MNYYKFFSGFPGENFFSLHGETETNLLLAFGLKLPPTKLYQSFSLLRLLFISINLPYGLAVDTVVIYGLVLLIGTWICHISYRNEYVGL